jgi:methylglutaconyl-CoA hydratase
VTNPIADPLVEVPDTDATSAFVRLDASPEGVAVVTLNRPAARNAFDGEMVGALHEVFQTLHAAEGVRVVFLRGAAGIFCAGLDLEGLSLGLEDYTEADHRDEAHRLTRMFKSLRDIPCLTVALVEGDCIGPGVGLVAVCDLAVAAAGARFGVPEVRLGLTPGSYAADLTAAVGPRAARALFATGGEFDAEQALAMELVSEIAADAAGLEAAMLRIADQVALTAPAAVAASKRLVAFVADRLADDVADEAARIDAAARVSPQGREGVRAAVEGRSPDWGV